MTTNHDKPTIVEKPVWFITGCSTGFGRELAKHVLERGYRTVVTARNPEDIRIWRPRAMLWRSSSTSRIGSRAARRSRRPKKIRTHRRAGEQRRHRLFRGRGRKRRRRSPRMFDINVFGLGRMIHAVLPGMRKRRHGFIVNISSIGGLRSFPSLGYYNATKFAVEGFPRRFARR